eukprot:CAMPEP_0196997686 /NCGR_PEP_ID=MMETSP1380-20130617/3231_1 /TAXON_ID=5936 /ORGANISM="Euplotes crassus, Strain CT5" /LENGTH=301 /DNA_ID=CAMNT_0042413993 /DNA_START=226 /DNA_END=1131 /DNA_ORIENTATION=+
MDVWKAKEVRVMELGGNKKAHTFYAKNNMFIDGRPDHENPALAKYKMGLAKQALADIGAASSTEKAAPAPTFAPVETLEKEEEKKEIFFEEISKPAAAATRVSNTQDSSSIYSFSNLKQNNQPANLNAKKLEVDFGGDDFFDSFGMGDKKEEKPKASNDNPFSIASTTKETSDEAGPFQIGAAASTRKSDNDEFVKAKLKELQGKKAISSEDFKQPEDDEHRENLKRFDGAKAISSADFFGEDKKEASSQDRSSINSLGRDSFGDKVSEAAIYAADSVAQNAKKLKEKAANFFSSFGRTSD